MSVSGLRTTFFCAALVPYRDVVLHANTIMLL
jgi:hypothetical protein